MNTTLTAAIISGCLLAAVLLGMRLRCYLPEHHLNAETKDVVKLAMGLVATMSALLLGLLVSSAKGSYDTARTEVIQMGAKVTMLDRVLRIYGPDAAPLRAQFHTTLRDAIGQIWAQDDAPPALNVHEGDALFAAIQNLSARDEVQHALKVQASSLGVELAQLRTLLHAQSVASISRPLLIVVVLWLVIIFLSFGVLAPPNATAGTALVVSALAVTGAIFLILEMDRPFRGLIQIPDAPLRNALKQITL